MVDRYSKGMDARRFLITGCQRSGTTLAAMALEAHPLIEMIEENDARFHIDGGETRKLDLEVVSDHAANGGRTIGYKAPRDSHRMDEIARTFPLVRIVWVEREIRQTVSSMLTLGGARNCWAAKFAPKEIRKYISKTRDGKARNLFALASEMEDGIAKSVTFAALCWMVKREQRYAAASLLGPRMLRVNYDEFVTDPQSVLRGFLDFLGLEWSPLVLNHSASIANVKRPGGADPCRPIDVVSRHKWKERLSRRDLEIIANVKQKFEKNGADNSSQLAS